jgi:ABC-type Fe3+/spermidine/putrescine transport system ATPase subunit
VGENVAVSIRPESIAIENHKIEKPANIYEGTVSGKTFLGSFYDYRINIHDQSFRVQTTSHKEFEIDSRIWVYIDPAYCKFIKR